MRLAKAGLIHNDTKRTAQRFTSVSVSFTTRIYDPLVRPAPAPSARRHSTRRRVSLQPAPPSDCRRFARSCMGAPETRISASAHGGASLRLGVLANWRRAVRAGGGPLGAPSIAAFRIGTSATHLGAPIRAVRYIRRARNLPLRADARLTWAVLSEWECRGRPFSVLLFQRLAPYSYATRGACLRLGVRSPRR